MFCGIVVGVKFWAGDVVVEDWVSFPVVFSWDDVKPVDGIVTGVGYGTSVLVTLICGPGVTEIAGEVTSLDVEVTFSVMLVNVDDPRSEEEEFWGKDDVVVVVSSGGVAVIVVEGWTASPVVFSCDDNDAVMPSVGIVTGVGYGTSVLVTLICDTGVTDIGAEVTNVDVEDPRSEVTNVEVVKVENEVTSVLFKGPTVVTVGTVEVNVKEPLMVVPVALLAKVLVSLKVNEEVVEESVGVTVNVVVEVVESKPTVELVSIAVDKVAPLVVLESTKNILGMHF